MERKLLIPIFLFFCILFSAQKKGDVSKITSKTNTNWLSKFVSDKRISDSKKRFELERYAKKYGWQKYIEKDSVFSELVGFTKDLRPIYYSTHNRGAGITSRASSLHTGGDLGLDINGEGMVAGVWDAALARPTHELYEGRVSAGDNTSVSNYHSTHVAGTIIGSESFRDGYAKGMAPKANVTSYDWNNDLTEVAQEAANGLLISNHSYGYDGSLVPEYYFGKYDQYSKDFDDILYNAPYYQTVCSAGNDRGYYNIFKNGYDVITGLGLSKNVITVGAVEEVLNYTGPESVVMSSFSNWGPTDDGRIKPDIVAKGVSLYSSLDDTDTSYGYLSGTSMSGPSVAGTLLLLQQYYNQMFGNYMRASTLKALMIHTADEAGAADGPDYSYGWGLINAKASAQLIQAKDVNSQIIESVLTTGSANEIVVAAKGDTPMVVTLVWTDPSGTLPPNDIDDSTPMLVNDLDVEVTQNDVRYYPWKMNPYIPEAAATKGDNTIDNVEKVEIPNASGNYKIVVKHKGTLVKDLQNYSLIISGISASEFWITTPEPVVDLCNTVTDTTVEFTLRRAADFTENVAFSVLNLPTGVTAQVTPTELSDSGTFSVTFSNISSLANGEYNVVVRGVANSNHFDVPLTLKIFDGTIVAPTLVSPLDAAESVQPNVKFEWSATDNTTSYVLEVSQTSTFDTVTEYPTEGTNYSLNLLNTTVYYWRVKSLNPCGESSYSTVYSFTTACEAPGSFGVASYGPHTLAVLLDPSLNIDQWEVEYVPTGTEPTGSGVVLTGTKEYIVDGLPANTCYDFYVRAVCSIGHSGWIPIYNICTQPDYCAGDHYYDTGGPDGDYENNADYYRTFYPENDGDRIRAIVHSFDLDYFGDNMKIFNGPDPSYPVLFDGSIMSELPAEFRSTDPSGALSFYLFSDDIGTGSGWDIEIICEAKPPCSYTLSDIKSSNSTISTIEIDWTDSSDATQWEIEVVPSGTKPTKAGVLTSMKPYVLSDLPSATCYDVYIRTICANGSGDWSDKVTVCTIPNYCGGDHFYDTGGVSGNYSSGEDWSKTIYPDNSTDRIRAIFNSFKIYDFFSGTEDQMIIYDGPDTTYPVLFQGYQMTLPSQFVSSDPTGSLTFSFHSDFGGDFSGWDAVILCEPKPACVSKPTDVSLVSASRTTLEIDWVDDSGATEWEVEIVPSGTTPTAAGVKTSVKPYIASLDSGTCYDVYVRSYCAEGTSDWAALTKVCTESDYCGGDHFYDTGGANGDYGDQENWTKTIYPDNAGDRVVATFNSFDINQEWSSDNFTIYNGPDNTFPVLFSGQAMSALPKRFASSHPSGALTFSFSSDIYGVASGWDAAITCEVMPPCPGIPSDLAMVRLGSRSIEINWSENSGATEWEVEVVPSGTQPTGTGIVTTVKPFVISNLQPETCYDIYVRSICTDGDSDWADPLTICTQPDYCAGAHFYDSGGPDGDYEDYANWTKTIYPEAEGDRIRVIFQSYNVEAIFDRFFIYDGPDDSSPLLYDSAYNTDAPTEYASRHPSGTLTFKLLSDFYGTQAGWDAQVICEPIPPCLLEPSGIQIVSTSLTTAKIDWAENSGATEWEIEAVPLGTTPTGVGVITTEKPFEITGLTNNTCYDVYVRSHCSEGISAWSNPVKVCTEADYCAGDHFYDTGGSTGNYGDYEDWTKTIYPTGTGNRVRAIFNTYDIEACCDLLTIYDGPDTTYPVLFSSGEMTDLPKEFAATYPDGALTFKFYSDPGVTAAGWDATIICEPLPPCAAKPTNVSLATVATTSLEVTWVENSNATEWEIEIVPSGVTPTGVGVRTNTKSYTFDNLTPGTCYDFLVRSICSDGISDWSDRITYCTGEDYCDLHFYDTGGIDGGYSSNEFWFKVLSSADGNSKVSVTFNSFEIEECCDRLIIIDGPDINSPVIFADGVMSGLPRTFTSSHPTGSLMMLFLSDPDTEYAGWDATVSCAALSVKEGKMNKAVIFPNPVKEDGILNILSPETISEIRVFNMNGALVYSEKDEFKTKKLDVTKLVTGTYIISLVTKDGSVTTHKFIKK